MSMGMSTITSMLMGTMANTATMITMTTTATITTRAGTRMSITGMRRSTSMGCRWAWPAWMGSTLRI